MRQYSDDSNGYGSSTGAFFTGLFAGAVIGAGLGLWFAPKAGTEMREQLAGTARDVSNKVSRTVNDLADRGREVFDRAREVMNTTGDQINQVASDVAKTANTSIRRGAQNIQAAAERS